MDTLALSHVYPSSWYIVKYILRKISTHPLIVNPPIYHPISGDKIYIDKYRLYNGIFLESEKLCLSIFPHSKPTDGRSLPQPNENSLSCYFDEEIILGDKEVKATYLIAIKLHYNTLKVFQPYPISSNLLPNQDNLTQVPLNLPTVKRERFIQEVGVRDIDLEINPALAILSDYSELVRLAILDKNYPADIGPKPGEFIIKYFNIKDGPWEKDKDIYFQEAEMLLMVDMRKLRVWNNNLTSNIECFDINVKIEN
jgi:hypothetical protein